MPETVHLASGKVREIFALGPDRLLLVATDRISTFDVVLPTEIPDKGRVWPSAGRAHAPGSSEPPARASRRRPIARVPASRDAAGRARRRGSRGPAGSTTADGPSAARPAAGIVGVRPAPRADRHAGDEATEDTT
jgi:hypothetical protein